jgi:sphinganine-1-phosphate aldolase
MYTTPTIAGSRSGGLIAQCWASLMALGEEGYMKHTEDIMQVVKTITQGVQRIHGLELLADSAAMIVCFAATKESGMNIYSVADKMAHKGWNINSLQSPPCLHLCCTVAHVGKENLFLTDLTDCVSEVRRSANNCRVHHGRWLCAASELGCTLCVCGNTGRIFAHEDAVLQQSMIL